MEEAIVEHLLGIVVDELHADLVQVIAILGQTLRVRDRYAVHIVHHHDMVRAPFHVGLGAADELHVRIVVAELLEVLRLDEEVRLLAE